MTVSARIIYGGYIIKLLSLVLPFVYHYVSPVNCPGQISLEEFIEGAEKDPWVLDQLKLDIGPCDWYIEQQKINEK